MPCIQKWHQESGNSGKPEYIEGHNYGIVSMVSREGERMRSMVQSRRQYQGNC
jgi:hypothetical protein